MEKQLSEETITAVEQFMSDILDKYLIHDKAIRREVARMMLTNPENFENAGHFFDVSELATKGFTGVIPKDAMKPRQKQVTVSSGLTNRERTILKASNMDIDVVFSDTSSMPHGLAYAQRIIDTARLVTSISTTSTNMLDIGGNYAMHALQGRGTNVHCCTLRYGEIEHHRQVQRDVQLELAGVEDINACYNGVENCEVEAESAISIHTLQDVDPDLWPIIFKKHGLKHVVAIMHYDPDMEDRTCGFVDAIGMHWQDKPNGMVEWYFDNDSSHSYVHNKSWMLRYGRSWQATLPEDPSFVVHYQVDFLADGRLQASLVRLSASTLKITGPSREFRYLGENADITLMVPYFDYGTGGSMYSSGSYKLRPMSTPPSMYSHAYKFGISNDTSRPDLPLAHSDLDRMVRAFNYVKKVNGVPITVPRKLEASVANSISNGMYLQVVHQRARNVLISKKLTMQIQGMHKRYGSESFLWFLVKSVSSLAILPAVFAAKTLSDAVSIYAVHMRLAMYKKRPLATAMETFPYHELTPVREVLLEPTGLMTLPDTSAGSNADQVQQPSVQEVVDAIGDDMPDELRSKFPASVSTSSNQSQTGAMPPSLDDEQHAAVVAEFEKVDSDLDIAPTRGSWLNAVDRFAQRQPPLTSFVHAEEGTNEQVMAGFYDRMYEYALYSMDVGLHDEGDALEVCGSVWAGGKFNMLTVSMLNVTQDKNIVILTHRDGEILDMKSTNEFKAVVDPITMRILTVHEKDGKYCVFGAHSDKLFTCKSLKLQNGLVLAAKTLRVMRNGDTVPSVSMDLEDGVPGCGKTHTIQTAFTLDDVICAAVKDTADDTRDHFSSIEGFATPAVLRSRIRTIDSAIMHGLPRAKTLYVDEGLAEHSGAICCLVMLCRPQRVLFCGDNYQIGLIQRGSGLITLRYAKMRYYHSVIERNITYRCPADVTRFIRQFYPLERQERIKTASPIRRSIRLVHEPDANSPVYKHALYPYTYLTVLQSDKQKLATSQGFRDVKNKHVLDARPVSSVHEAQGGTYPMISISRMNAHTTGVFDSAPHQNVMVSRGLLVNEYKTVLSNSVDKMAAKLTVAVAYTDQELDEVCVETPEWLEEKMAKQLAKYSKYL